MVYCLRNVSSVNEKTEVTLCITSFLQSSLEPLLSQWLIKQLQLMEVVALNFNMGTTQANLRLVKASLDLIELIFSTSTLNEVLPNVSSLSLPLYLEEMSREQTESKTMIDEFERKGGLDAIETLLYCKNPQIFKQAHAIIQQHFGIEKEDAQREMPATLSV